MLPERVYVPTKEEQDFRSLVQHRKQLVKDQTRTINRAHALLTRNGIFVTKKCLNGKVENWKEILEKQIVDKNFVYIEFECYMEQSVQLKRQLETIERLIGQEVERMYGEENELLLSIPGVGGTISAAALAYCGDIGRFEDARRYQSYWGLVPRLRESDGQKSGNGGITKMGPSILRGYLIQGVLSLLSRKNKAENKPLCEFYDRIRKRKGWKKARIALARKVLGIMYGVLKNKIAYNPKYLNCVSKDPAEAALEPAQPGQGHEVKRYTLKKNNIKKWEGK